MNNRNRPFPTVDDLVGHIRNKMNYDPGNTFLADKYEELMKADADFFKATAEYQRKLLQIEESLNSLHESGDSFPQGLM